MNAKANSCAPWLWHSRLPSHKRPQNDRKRPRNLPGKDVELSIRYMTNRRKASWVRRGGCAGMPVGVRSHHNERARPHNRPQARAEADGVAAQPLQKRRPRPCGRSGSLALQRGRMLDDGGRSWGVLGCQAWRVGLAEEGARTAKAVANLPEERAVVSLPAGIGHPPVASGIPLAPRGSSRAEGVRSLRERVNAHPGLIAVSKLARCLLAIRLHCGVAARIAKAHISRSQTTAQAAPARPPRPAGRARILPALPCCPHHGCQVRMDRLCVCVVGHVVVREQRFTHKRRDPAHTGGAH